MSVAQDIVSAVLVLGGVAIITLGVLGLFRMPDAYTRVQAAAKAPSLGTAALLLAAALHGDGHTIARAVLITAFLLITAPAAAHAIARAAYLRGEVLYDPTDGG